MPLKIEVKKPQNLKKAVARLKGEAMKHKLRFDGDERNGRGSGYGFDVSYAVLADGVSLTVHKKPFVVSEAKIIKTVRDFYDQYLKEEDK